MVLIIILLLQWYYYENDINYCINVYWRNTMKYEDNVCVIYNVY